MRARPLLAWGAGVVVLSLVLDTQPVRTPQTPARSTRSSRSSSKAQSQRLLPTSQPFSALKARTTSTSAALLPSSPQMSESSPAGTIPIGEPVGELSAHATLGLINAVCNTAIPVDFTFYNSSLGRNSFGRQDTEGATRLVRRPRKGRVEGRRGPQRRRRGRRHFCRGLRHQGLRRGQGRQRPPRRDRPLPRVHPAHHR